MTDRVIRQWPLVILGTILLLLLGFTLKPYDGNLSALFHLDTTMTNAHPFPKGFVVLQVPGYDGAQYYQIARHLPKILQPSQWTELTTKPPSAYAYQRILLPLLAGILSLGHERALPILFPLINLLALLATCLLLLQWKRGTSLYALALCLSPPALLALHFDLSEPLTILLLTAFLIRFLRKERIDAASILFISLVVLSREVNILFVLALGAWLLWERRLREALWLLIPVLVFLGLHSLIYLIFHQIPFLWSTDKSGLPLSAIWELLIGERGYNVYTLSAIALFLSFVVPALWIVCRQIVQEKKRDVLTYALGLFLGIMLCMPDHIWGSITSIGRVITPVYPLFMIHGALHDTWLHRVTALFVAILGLVTAIGLALIVHPSIVTP